MPALPEPAGTDGSAWPTMSVVVSSYQRRGPLFRLLEALANECTGDPGLVPGLDVIVSLDGSTDGSRESLAEASFPFPLTVLWHENSGLAATRNAGWQHSTSAIVWFLDDDLVPAPGLLRRHRAGHAVDSADVLMGPCVIAESSATTSGMREWWDDRYAAMERDGVTRFDQFSAANTSCPRDVLERVGGFDARFIGYGWEDYEFGLRLLDAGFDVRFDAAAVAWHDQHRTQTEAVRLRREEGRNVARFAHMHPGRTDALLGAGAVRPLPRQAVRPLLAASGVLNDGLDVALRSAERRERRGQAVPFARVLLHAAFAAGVLEQDSDGRATTALLAKALGRSRAALSRA